MKKLLYKLEITDSESFWRFCKQFFKFGIVGISNAVVALTVYYTLLYIGVHYLISNTLSFILVVCNTYFWNRKYVFKQKESASHIKSFLRVSVAYGIALLTGTILLYLFVDIIGISEYIAPFLGLPVTVPLNFLINKYWAFKEKKD